MYRLSLWNTIVVIPKNLVRWASVEQWQGRAVAADLHQVCDQTFDALVLAHLSLKTLAK